MPKKKLIRTSIYPYHITARSNNKEGFYIPISDVWNFSQIILEKSKVKFKIQVKCFVLMNNHYHMLLYTPLENIDKFMQFFNQNLGKSIAKQAGRINRIFGASYKWNLIISGQYHKNVIRYIYQNPVRARLVSKCGDYPYSNFSDYKFSSQMLTWINSEMSQAESKKTTTNLRRYVIE